MLFFESFGFPQPKSLKKTRQKSGITFSKNLWQVYESPKHFETLLIPWKIYEIVAYSYIISHYLIKLIYKLKKYTDIDNR